jgi:eukaryotic-like serine/threonine-protein kinase
MPIPGNAGQAQPRLGRYELLARLATGGMGEIFLARLEGAEGFEKLYVVKRILAHLADDARFRQMLIAEARIASKMSHPNICQVFELGETAGQLYIVMEYLEGVSVLPMLRRFSREGIVPELGFVAGVLQQVTDAMNYAHELKDRDGENLGIIHRDVTPSNIFLTEAGVAKVLDFGIAKARGASTQTQEGTVKGKYAYMAPEQLKGSNIDRRVDIFALGVVLYEMLALRRLFQRKTDYLTFRAVMEQPIPDIRRYRPELPNGVAEALARALERDPGARFETARQFGTAILDGMEGVRPWSQGEISDFVNTNFADEIGKRSQQVASVVARTQSGVSTRATMPLLIHPDEAMHDDDDDDFPPVETEVEGAPPWMPKPGPAPLSPGNSADFQGGTPPPFGIESTGSAPMLQPLQRPGSPVMPPNPNTQPIMVMPRRSVFWPIFGVLMVMIAGGALFLVWQQMQNQQQQPSEIKITQEPADKPLDDPNKLAVNMNPTTAPDAQAEDSGSGSATSGSAEQAEKIVKKDRGPKEKSFRDQVSMAVGARIGDLKGCLNQHQSALPPKGTVMMADISINANGRTKSVSLTPADVDASPLGVCLKNVIKATQFPKGLDTGFKIPLSPKSG